MFDYVLAGLAAIACFGACIAAIYFLNPIIEKIREPWQTASCQLIGAAFGLLSVYLMIEAVK